MIETCDAYFYEWWRLRIIELYPLHEVPQAWLMMMISIEVQKRLNSL